MLVIHFDIAKISEEIKALESKMDNPDFWNNQQESTKTLTSLKQLKNKQDKFNKLNNTLNNLIEMNELLSVETDETLVDELLESTLKLENELEILEVETLLSGKYDKNNAILTLHPGAGGTESQDWAEMLYRMYSKWAIKNDFIFKELDYLEGDEAGIKSVTFSISGENAYGYLKGEMGVHRLIRISPFDSGGRRHTSFASLEVLPEITDDVEVYINPEDLRIDTYRASRSRRTTY